MYPTSSLITTSALHCSTLIYYSIHKLLIRLNGASACGLLKSHFIARLGKGAIRYIGSCTKWELVNWGTIRIVFSLLMLV